MLCRAADSLLLVVDIQSRLAAAMPATDLQRVLHASGILLQAAAALSLPVLVTEQYPQGLGPTHEDIRRHLPPGTHTFDKTCFSCCGASGLLDAIKDSGRRQVIVAGMEAHVCVLQTAAGLQTHGLEVFVVEDAVCSRTDDNRRNALDRLRQNGIGISNMESVMFEWLRDAQHEKFRELSRLLR